MIFLNRKTRKRKFQLQEKSCERERLEIPIIYSTISFTNTKSSGRSHKIQQWAIVQTCTHTSAGSFQKLNHTIFNHPASSALVTQPNWTSTHQRWRGTLRESQLRSPCSYRIQRWPNLGNPWSGKLANQLVVVLVLVLVAEVLGGVLKFHHLIIGDLVIKEMGNENC